MKEFEIIRTGKRQDGSFWSQLKNEDGDFILTAFVQTVTEKEVGQSIEVPSRVADALQWEA